MKFSNCGNNENNSLVINLSGNETENKKKSILWLKKTKLHKFSQVATQFFIVRIAGPFLTACLM